MGNLGFACKKRICWGKVSREEGERGGIAQAIQSHSTNFTHYHHPASRVRASRLEGRFLFIQLDQKNKTKTKQEKQKMFSHSVNVTVNREPTSAFPADTMKVIRRC